MPGTLKDETVVVGTGATPNYRRGESSAQTELACQTILGAFEDAGLTVGDLDGFTVCSSSCAIATFTVVRHPLAPRLAEVVPHVSGVIELDGIQGAGRPLPLDVTDADPETMRIGDKVRTRFGRVSDALPLPRARMAPGQR